MAIVLELQYMKAAYSTNGLNFSLYIYIYILVIYQINKLVIVS